MNQILRSFVFALATAASVLYSLEAVAQSYQYPEVSVPQGQWKAVIQGHRGTQGIVFFTVKIPTDFYCWAANPPDAARVKAVFEYHISQNNLQSRFDAFESLSQSGDLRGALQLFLSTNATTPVGHFQGGTAHSTAASTQYSQGWSLNQPYEAELLRNCLTGADATNLALQLRKIGRAYFQLPPPQ